MVDRTPDGKRTPHHARITTAITVVAIMIFSALPLDSWMPRRFWRKKYSVIRQAITTAPQRRTVSAGPSGEGQMRAENRQRIEQRGP